jgi:hypothetical protein
MPPLDNARRVAGPVLERVASGQAPGPALRMSAVLADATLRDELLAPGFLTAALAERVRAARIAGAQVTVDVARPGDAVLSATARRLLAAALAGLAAGDGVTLKVYPAAEGYDERYSALLILHVRGRPSDHVALRRSADKCGALVSPLADHELLIRFQPAPEPAAAEHERPADLAGRSLRTTSGEAQVRDLPHGCAGWASIRPSRLLRWASISAGLRLRSKSGARLTVLAPGMLVPMYPRILPAASCPIVMVVLAGGSADRPPMRRRIVP